MRRGGHRADRLLDRLGDGVAALEPGSPLPNFARFRFPLAPPCASPACICPFLPPRSLSLASAQCHLPPTLLSQQLLHSPPVAAGPVDPPPLPQPTARPKLSASEAAAGCTRHPSAKHRRPPPAIPVADLRCGKPTRKRPGARRTRRTRHRKRPVRGRWGTARRLRARPEGRAILSVRGSMSPAGAPSPALQYQIAPQVEPTPPEHIRHANSGAFCLTCIILGAWSSHPEGHQTLNFWSKVTSTAETRHAATATAVWPSLRLAGPPRVLASAGVPLVGGRTLGLSIATVATALITVTATIFVVIVVVIVRRASLPCTLRLMQRDNLTLQVHRLHLAVAAPQEKTG